MPAGMWATFMFYYIMRCISTLDRLYDPYTVFTKHEISIICLVLKCSAVHENNLYSQQDRFIREQTGLTNYKHVLLDPTILGF